MIFNCISKSVFIFLLLFTISCQNRISFFDEDKELVFDKYDIEKKDKVDLVSIEILEENSFDYFSNETSDYDFLRSKINKIKINNYKKTIENSLTINSYIIGSSFFSINHKAEILEFDKIGKLISKHPVELTIPDLTPISFSIIKNDFIIGFKSGEIVKTNKIGKVIWKYKKQNFLNTPIKFLDGNLIALYPEYIVFISPENGKVIYEKKYESNKILQSTGGKLINFFNILYFILPNSEFHVIDTFLFDEYSSELDSISIETSLNNLDDIIHNYKNLLVYLDNGRYLYTYDIIENKFLLNKFKINLGHSTYLFNNTIISNNNKNIYFYNIKNGNLFFNINIEKKLNKNSEIVSVMAIDKKLHLFFNNGKLLILDELFKINKIIDLKIKKISKVFSYQNKIFINTESGHTFIF